MKDSRRKRDLADLLLVVGLEPPAALHLEEVPRLAARHLHQFILISGLDGSKMHIWSPREGRDHQQPPKAKLYELHERERGRRERKRERPSTS